MRVYVTSVGTISPDAEPVRQPYTRPDASALDCLHAITSLLSQGESPYYKTTKIEIEL